MVYREKTLSPAEQARFENAVAQAETNKAIIDYIAMMADIEIPTENETVEEANNE